MRSIKIITVIIISPLLAGLMLAGVVNATPEAPEGKSLSSASPDNTTGSFGRTEGAGYVPPAAPAMRPTGRISIPYGFAPIFPIRSNGQEVLVSGHGSCTEGETFTVVVTVTHAATGIAALGNLEEVCTGEALIQEWQLTAAVDGDSMPAGPAESCGFVQTFEGEAVTDEQDWCVDVNVGNYLFLPIALH